MDRERVREERKGTRTAFRAGYDFGSSKCSALILLGRESRVVRKDFANESSVIVNIFSFFVWVCLRMSVDDEK